jgi:hypothetical protein
MTVPEFEYVSGSCNIGKGEIRRRQAVALIGLILTITTTFGVLTTDSVKSARLAVFIPALIFAIGFIQSRRKFCLAFGLMGTFNFKSLGNLSRVASPEDRRRDRRTITLIIYLLPL